MASIVFNDLEKYGAALGRLLDAAQGDDLLEQAVAAGAAPVADQIRANLEAIPEDTFRYLGTGEKFSGIPESQKRDLLDSLGITPAGRDRNGIINVKIGFDGYGSHPTEAYPYGLPNQLLARVVESGSSVRDKTPFVRPAVRAAQAKAIDEMAQVIDNAMTDIFD